MKVLAWGFSSLHFSEIFSREVAKLSFSKDLVLQIDSEARTADYTGVRGATFVRALSFEPEDLRREVAKVRPDVLVFDMWTALFAEKCDALLLSLKSLLTKESAHLKGFIFFGPSLACSEMNGFPLEFVGKVRRFHETVWNSRQKSLLALVTSAPPLESALAFLKTDLVVCPKRLGLSLVPDFCAGRQAEFVTVAGLAKVVAGAVEYFSEARPNGIGSEEKWIEVASDQKVDFSAQKRAFKCSWQSYFRSCEAQLKTTHKSSEFSPGYLRWKKTSAVAEVLFRFAVAESNRGARDFGDHRLQKFFFESQKSQ